MQHLINIRSPKRTSQRQTEWEGFFPYYAGFPEAFAEKILSSVHLDKDAKILDPWNGSGTTTYVASKLGYKSIGFDINPVMVILARSRLLPSSEADSLRPLALKLINELDTVGRVDQDDELCSWFNQSSAGAIRALEWRIRSHLVGNLTLGSDQTHWDRISGMASTFYVALFAVCRDLVKSYRASNPTWLRKAKNGERKISVSIKELSKRFLNSIDEVAAVLVNRQDDTGHKFEPSNIRVQDSTDPFLGPNSVDFVLTSPPYCTRIDYTAATRVELAVLAPLLVTNALRLSQQMIGSTRVPSMTISPSEAWGNKCLEFLNALQKHPSKASQGYYYKNHADYFRKVFKSLQNLSGALKTGGQAVIVVQDSYYKNLHNDLPAIIEDMLAANGLFMFRRSDFEIQRSMVGVNPYSRMYERARPIESVLCFEKLI